MGTTIWATARIWLALLLCFGMTSTVNADVIDVSKIEPTCNLPFEYKDGRCVPKPGELDKLNDDKKCAGPWLKFASGKCSAADAAPEPACNEPIADLKYRDKKCVVDRQVPRSASGDFVGDCFEILARPANGRGIPAPPITRLKVLSQKPVAGDDKELTVSAADGTGVITCRSVANSQATQVLASDLIAVGAKRVGWTYGVLALPYKYYAHDRSFGSGVSIGPYFGRRWGTPGTAFTFAASATIGSVKGEVRDTQGNVTSTPDLQAFSVATGYMWDISKSPGVKPFKLGVFVGTDLVGSNDSVKYVHNRKPWIALQVGFDFTDN